ncbi:4-alpha-glucanotransferase [Methanoregula sp.]|uniref:4-alpha-glucanotransferase n=1 Tax=Methanoregula sp. TaxID=2052170 RepID=UPI00356A61F9
MSCRGSGILLHVTSLPSPFGIGDLGPPAYRFADFLQDAGQKYWQILPLTPTAPLYDNSPYMSSSAFAGNIGLISPELMIREGFLEMSDCKDVPAFPKNCVDYEGASRYKKTLFSRAYHVSSDTIQASPHYQKFCRDQSGWLEDYAIFQSLTSHFGDTTWDTWPEKIKKRDGESLEEIKNQLRDEIEKEKFLQFIFFNQWKALHRYCLDKGIFLIGDMPIYVNHNSADVWAHPDLFRLDAHGKPTVVAGVPPDYFSKTGQLWKNPLYHWQEHERTGFSWWISRFRQNFALFDTVRIDHFRGLVAYWEVPADATDATRGTWVRAPGEQFLTMMKTTFSAFPVIAEDLGVITPDVHDLMRQFHLPGMRVLQFAFTDETSKNPHAPHNLSRELVLYTGTHDNSPVRGWFEHHATPEDKRRLFQYLGREYSADELPEVFIRLAMMSVADTVILPLQDILGLGEEARMNTPGTDEGNWRWRVEEPMTKEIAGYLHDMTRVFGRA